MICNLHKNNNQFPYSSTIARRNFFVLGWNVQHFRLHATLRVTYAVLDLRLVLVVDLVASCMMTVMEQSMLTFKNH
jgi:hypothetical protein